MKNSKKGNGESCMGKSKDNKEAKLIDEKEKVKQRNMRRGQVEKERRKNK